MVTRDDLRPRVVRVFPEFVRNGDLKAELDLDFVYVNGHGWNVAVRHL
jgi:hypothetical protein